MPETADNQPAAGKPSFVSAYAIFEGGGARGIAHVGALRAMEAAGLALAGVAGTSAGAIFAALVAVGYRPDEIFKDGQNHILTTLGHNSPVALIGESTWRHIKTFKLQFALMFGGIVVSTLLSTALGAIVVGEALGGLAGPLAIVLAVCGVTLLLMRTILLVLGGIAALTVASAFQWGGQWPPMLIPAILFVTMLVSSLIALLWLRPLLSRQGLVDNSVVEDIVNAALLRKLAETWDQETQGQLPDKVLFRHIEPDEARNKFIPLKVVATNIDRSRLVIIDRRHPDVAVAQAVAASAALPLLFRPAQVNGLDDHGYRYADGGLVSNLPSWVFRDEKRQQERFEAFEARQFRRIPVFAVSLVDPESEVPGQNDGFKALLKALLKVLLMELHTSYKYFLNLGNTAVFGGQAVVQSFISDLRAIPIETTLKTMDLDCTGPQAEHQVNDAERQVRDLLREERKRDRLALAILEDIRSQIALELSTSLGEAGITAATIRAVLLRPLRRDPGAYPVALQVQLIAGGDPESNTDDELELDLQGNIAAAAYDTGKITFGQIGGVGAGPLKMTKYEHALLPSHLRSAVAIPISAPDGTIECVVCVDSHHDILALKGDKPFKQRLEDLSLPLRSDLFDHALESTPHDQ